MIWRELPDAEAVEVVRRALDEWFRGSHYVNVLIRRNGKDEVQEADWLKHIPELLDRLSARREPAP